MNPEEENEQSEEVKEDSHQPSVAFLCGRFVIVSLVLFFTYFTFLTSYFSIIQDQVDPLPVRATEGWSTASYIISNIPRVLTLLILFLWFSPGPRTLVHWFQKQDLFVKILISVAIAIFTGEVIVWLYG